MRIFLVWFLKPSFERVNHETPVCKWALLFRVNQLWKIDNKKWGKRKIEWPISFHELSHFFSFLFFFFFLSFEKKTFLILELISFEMWSALTIVIPLSLAWVQQSVTTSFFYDQLCFELRMMKHHQDSGFSFSLRILKFAGSRNSFESLTPFVTWGKVTITFSQHPVSCEVFLRRTKVKKKGNHFFSREKCFMMLIISPAKNIIIVHHVHVWHFTMIGWP